MSQVYRISLGPASDRALRDIARAQGVASDHLVVSYVLAGIEQSKLSLPWRIIKFLLTCFLTAVFVLIGLRMMSIFVPQLSAPIEIPLDRALHWARIVVLSFVPWPVTILIALWIVARSGSAFDLLLGLFGSLRKIKLFGAELELSEHTKRKIQSATAEIRRALLEYKRRADEEISRLAAMHQIEDRLAEFLDSAEMKRLAPNREQFRCTVHIPDPIEFGRLYQLVDYYPTGSGVSRTFSTRYGIIGKVWRTGDPLLEPDLTDTQKGGAARPVHEIIKTIMKDWGMRRNEAERAISHQSYFSFLLEHDQTKVGLIYMDAMRPNAFTAGHEAAVIALAKDKLAPVVSKMLDELASISLQIDLERD